MKLVDLDPRWLVDDGRRVGFIFKCPTDPYWWQSCMFEAYTRQGQWKLFAQALHDSDDEDPHLLVQGCSQDMLWKPTPYPALATFETLSVYPSVDGSAGGLWHGWITNGEAT